MKRAVSVMMAIAMILCMCPQVFAAPRAYIFSDIDDINEQYFGAVDMAFDFGILSGYSDGTFRPKNGLTRGAAAKIITTANAQSDYTAQSATFKDVPLNHTFANCIAYCVSRKMISGYSDGTFQPSSPLTGYAFAKMLLNNIEYAKDASRYTGASWKSAVSADAAATGISNLIPTLDKNITREEAAQMWYASWNYEEEHWDDEDDVAFDWEDETPDMSSPAPNTAVVSLDDSEAAVFYLGYSEQGSQSKYRFYLFKLGSESRNWQRLVLDIAPKIAAGQTAKDGNWNGMNAYDPRKLEAVWSDEAGGVRSFNKTSITMKVNQNNGAHMEGEFEAYNTLPPYTKIYGSFNLNFGEYNSAANRLYNEVGRGPVSDSSASSSDDFPVFPDGSSSSGKSRGDPCVMCNATGDCSWCRGSGRYDGKRCPVCNGSQRCGACGGDGIL